MADAVPVQVRLKRKYTESKTRGGNAVKGGHSGLRGKDAAKRHKVGSRLPDFEMVMVVGHSDRAGQDVPPTTPYQGKVSWDRRPRSGKR